MPLERRIACCVTIAVALACGAAHAVEPLPQAPTALPIYRRIKVSLGYHYSTGDYGSSESTEIDYVPLAITGEIDRWTLQLTIPYLHIDGPAGIIEGPNGPIQTNDGESDGLGDLLARGGFLVPIRRLVPETIAFAAWMPYVEAIGLVKFPTASRSAGLGTGEFDFGLEVELTWVVGRFAPFATAGVRFLGSPPDTHLSNVFVGSLGGLYRILDPLSAGLLLDYRQSPSTSTGERLDLVPFVSWQFIAPWSADLYVSAGLADGSPDVGTGLQIGYAF